MKRIKSYQLISHVLFWLLYILVFHAVSTKYNAGPAVPWRNLVTPAIQIGLVYFIRYYVFRKYYKNGNPLLFSVIALSLILYFIPVSWMITMLISKINVTFSMLFTIDTLLAYAVTIGLVFISTSVTLLLEKEREKNERGKFEREKKEIELFALKSQIDSHFLFNTLNNIYGLALKKSDLAPRGILLLSEILSFVIYETKKDYYPLSKEIQLINNYIELERIRYNDGFSIDFRSNEISEDSFITPLILFTFLENSFKHGISRTMPDPWVKIRLKSSVSEVFFEIENSVPCDPGDPADKGTGGIGLENIRRRLTLLYPQMHSLVTRRDQNSFYVGLTLYNNY